MQGTTIVLPNRVLQPGQHLNLGGQAWQVLAHPHAHTESHLSLWQAQAHIWVPAGLVAWDGLPDGARSQGDAWLRALQDIAQRQPRAIWGGTDARTGLLRWVQTRGYWHSVQEQLDEVQAQGASLLEVLPSAVAPSLSHLPFSVPNDLAVMRHQHNLLREWQRREDTSFAD
jgi:hypothetical protein